MTGRDPAADGPGADGVEPVADGPGADAAEPAGVEQAVADGAEQVDPEQPAPLVIKRRGRRVSTEPAPGYIGEPAREQHQSSENDQRLKGDVPPHWG